MTEAEDKTILEQIKDATCDPSYRTRESIERSNSYNKQGGSPQLSSWRSIRLSSGVVVTNWKSHTKPDSKLIEQGLCIICGEYETHERPKKRKHEGRGILGRLNRGHTTLVPLDPNVECYKGHFCKSCFSGGIVTESQNLSPLPDTVWQPRASNISAKAYDVVKFPNVIGDNNSNNNNNNNGEIVVESAIQNRPIMLYPCYEQSDDDEIAKEEVKVYLQTDGDDSIRPVAYHRVKSITDVKIPFGKLVYCTQLKYYFTREESSANTKDDNEKQPRHAFRNPHPRDIHKSAMVAIKQIRKEPYFGLGADDSPFKDASVLKIVGEGRDNGILDCHQILQDKHFWYLVCRIQYRHRPLYEMAGPPPSPWSFMTTQNTITASTTNIYYNNEDLITTKMQRIEGHIKPLFQDLCNAILTIHQRGICNRNLDPTKILLTTRDNNNNNATTITATTISQQLPSLTPLLSCFCASVLVPMTPIQRGYIIPSNNDNDDENDENEGRSTTTRGSFRFMAPEVYARNFHDGLAADIWSLGIVLFELLAFPCKLFSLPTRHDPLYGFWIFHCKFVDNLSIPQDITERLVEKCLEEVETGDGDVATCTTRRFQQLHEAIDAVHSLSDKARVLLRDLLNENPNQRPSIQEVLEYPWFTEEEYRTRPSRRSAEF